MDQKTEEPIKDEKGETITAEKDFTAGSSEEKIEVEFTFDASKLEEKDIVVFEELYELSDEGEEVLVAEHKEITDKGQTIHVRKIQQKKISETENKNPKKGVVKTGDTSRIGYLLILFTAAFAVIVLLIRKRRS